MTEILSLPPASLAASTKALAENHGAIAFSEETGAVGYSYDHPTRDAAETKALEECGPGCKVVQWFRNACGALATGDNDMLLDMRAATFISVEGLEWLEELLLRSQSKQRSVRFVNVPPPIYKVFKVAHIDSLLQACGAPAAASGPVC